MKINIPANTKTVILNIASNEMIELKNAVNEAKIKLGLSNSELSKLIGHSRNYISETLRIGASTEKSFKAGQQSKQAEVDELQKRIDDALHEADESCGVSVDAFVKLNKILKGDSHES